MVTFEMIDDDVARAQSGVMETGVAGCKRRNRADEDEEVKW